MIHTSGESKRKFHQEAIGPADNGQSSSSWGCHRVSEQKGEMSMKLEEVRKLKKKLIHLEEETHMMKQEMFQNTAERKTLLNDIHRQLKRIQLSFHPENQALGYKFCEKQEGGREDGLSQVLYEDWNPSVVIRRGSRAYSVGVKHLIHRV